MCSIARPLNQSYIDMCIRYSTLSPRRCAHHFAALGCRRILGTSGTASAADTSCSCCCCCPAAPAATAPGDAAAAADVVDGDAAPDDAPAAADAAAACCCCCCWSCVSALTSGRDALCGSGGTLGCAGASSLSGTPGKRCCCCGCEELDACIVPCPCPCRVARAVLLADEEGSNAPGPAGAAGCVGRGGGGGAPPMAGCGSMHSGRPWLASSASCWRCCCCCAISRARTCSGGHAWAGKHYIRML